MKVAGSIITFNPDLEKLNINFNLLYEQVDKLILIDNNSSNVDSILQMIKGKEVIYVLNNRNLGLGLALNTALNKAKDLGCEWLLTLDQDSTICNNYVDKCKEVLNRVNSPYVGIISPIVINRNICDYKVTEINENIYPVSACITSGAFTNVNAAISSGGFDGEMFIDQIDYDMCFKLRVNGFYTYKYESIYIIHELGKVEKKSIFLFNYLTTNHSAKRLFTIYRNFYILRKRYVHLANNQKDIKEWFRKSCLRLLFRPFKIILSENNKTEKICSICLGIKEGVKIARYTGK